ncbi:MAG: cytochrome c [Pirellulales bacterium]|nr:cytochrome c [Pirellulales bacterium]
MSPIRRLLPTAYCLLLATLPGCGPAPLATFGVNTEGRDPSKLGRTEIEAIHETIAESFGTPDVPELPDEARLDRALLGEAAGPIAGDRQGRQRGLYRQHCAACHDLSGGGAGPHARLLGTYPMDFRLGQFKYTSTRDGGKPVRRDLERTLAGGLPGTAMPSFARLPQEQIDALVEYVIYLSVRGEAERAVAGLVLDEGEYLPLDEYLVEDEAITPVAEQWKKADSLVVDEAEALRAAPPLDTADRRAASVERGRVLFESPNAQCTTCHGPEGRGDGEQQELYDDWNKLKKGVSDEQTRALAERFALPLVRLRARNFHEGIFRGGDRPIDVYWRIHVGLKGTPMPSSGPDSSTEGVFSPAEIWDVANFVLSLSGN